MRRVFLCFSTIIFFLSFLDPKAFAAETIRDFSVGIQVNQDGAINVEERIEYDFGSLWRHGIFREIPFIKETGGSGDQGNKKYKLDMREPEWYRGYERNGFNSAILVNSLARSFSSVASAASPPTSTTSSSGFSSGFSGGFSGGGGGGGGGGSW